MIAAKQIAENYVETGRKKAELPVSHMLILGFFAGMFIALAGAGASVASAAMTGGLHRGGAFYWKLSDDDLGAAETDFLGRTV